MDKIHLTDRDNIHSEEINDIITQPPAWLHRWGISIFCGGFLLIFALTAFIEYPDIIKVQIEIESEIPPVNVMAKESGKVIRLLVKNNTKVVQGQLLAYMESAGGGTGNKNTYAVRAPQPGVVFFTGLLHVNSARKAGEKVFVISPESSQLYGVINIPEDLSGKVKQGQELSIKLKSYPFEQYGVIRARLIYIADYPEKDSIFLGKVVFENNNPGLFRKIRAGMRATAEIKSESHSLLKRLSTNLFHVKYQ